MKILDWIKIFGSTPYKDDSLNQYKVLLNEVELDGKVVISNRSHSKTYKLLRKIKTPMYDNIFLMRKKKGFNTFMFIINYDIIVADKNGIVLSTMTDVEPGFISEYYKDGSFVYFAPVGTINFYKIKKRDVLSVRKLWLEKKR